MLYVALRHIALNESGKLSEMNMDVATAAPVMKRAVSNAPNVDYHAVKPKKKEHTRGTKKPAANQVRRTHVVRAAFSAERTRTRTHASAHPTTHPFSDVSKHSRTH